MSVERPQRPKTGDAPTTMLADILDTESNWLRQAKADLSRRDPVDALNDAEALVEFATLNLSRLFEQLKR